MDADYGHRVPPKLQPLTEMCEKWGPEEAYVQGGLKILSDIRVCLNDGSFTKDRSFMKIEALVAVLGNVLRGMLDDNQIEE